MSKGRCVRSMQKKKRIITCIDRQSKAMEKYLVFMDESIRLGKRCRVTPNSSTKSTQSNSNKNSKCRS